MKRYISLALILSNFCLLMPYSKGSMEGKSIIDQVKVKLKEVNDYYTKNPNYEVSINQKIYSNAYSKVPEVQFNGYYKYKNQKEHSLIHGIETIQRDEWRVVIDSNTKTISLNKPKKSENVSLEVLSQSMKMCKSATLIDSNNLCTVDLYFNPDTYPMSHIKIKIANHRIILLEMWHSAEISEDNQKIFPHTVIEYNEYKENPKFKNSEFETNHVLRLDGKKIALVGKYKSYSFYDLRVQQ